MQKDIRETALYKEAEDLYRKLRRPGSGLLSDVADISTDGTHAFFAGSLAETLTGTPPTRICATHLTTGDTRVLTFGPGVDRLPKLSPDGARIAFLSDRHHSGDFQLYLLDPVSGASQPAARVNGWVEYLQWSPDGKRVLLGVACHGADVAGAQGAVTSKQGASEAPSWMPEVAPADTGDGWRSVWVFDLAADSVRQVSPVGLNFWEATWCGADSFAALVSLDPGEGAWYSARLDIIAIDTGQRREVYASSVQMGWPAASPSGSKLAVVEALCSDRGLVAGDVQLVDVASGEVRRLDTRAVDVTYAEWRSNSHLLLAGHRNLETVIGLYDATSDSFVEMWHSHAVTTGGLYATAAGFGETGDCVLVGEGFFRAPEIAVIRDGNYQTVKSFGPAGSDLEDLVGTEEQVSWVAGDGLEICGLLLRPKGEAPYPLVMSLHGGPVWHWRPFWLGRRSVPILMLLKRGYAVFFPNPRGSSGRGQSFVRPVLGDIGGADGHDCLAGVDHLVQCGVADPKRLGISGGSYGGYMSAWLTTQDTRFAASVPVSPITNYVTEHLISNIPHFVSLFLTDHYRNSGGKYFERSPIMYAHKVKTPTLVVCGALDRCTPAEEAVQFHSALRESAVESVLLTYPEEGHGVRNFPALIDYAARFVFWFESHMPATS